MTAPVKYFCLGLLFIGLNSPTAYALINAVLLQGHEDLVRLEFHQREAVCTGFFVGPTTLITSAHCLYRDNQVKWEPSDLVFVGGSELKVKALQLTPHPGYLPGQPEFDVGIVKTTLNSNFSGTFHLAADRAPVFGNAKFFGAGKVDLDRGLYGRAQGDNYFVRLGSTTYSLGRSENTSHPGHTVTIAPNDSGGPIVDNRSGEVVAISSRTTIKESWGTAIPAVSIGTSLLTKENRAFVQAQFSGRP
jgi:hypothetical protein